VKKYQAVAVVSFAVIIACIVAALFGMVLNKRNPSTSRDAKTE
jgi:hypothetical protein